MSGVAFPVKFDLLPETFGARVVSGEPKSIVESGAWLRNRGLELWQSGLKGCLKPTVAVVMMFADESGRGVLPLMEEFAWLLGQSMRITQTQLSQLRTLGVLRLSGGSGIGRSMRREFRLNFDRLPKRGAWAGTKQPRVLRLMS